MPEVLHERSQIGIVPCTGGPRAEMGPGRSPVQGLPSL